MQIPTVTKTKKISLILKKQSTMTKKQTNPNIIEESF